MDKEIIIKDTHRGLKYVDGVLTEVLSAGRYRLPAEANLGTSAGPPFVGATVWSFTDCRD
jgi:hypothetical protein